MKKVFFEKLERFSENKNTINTSGSYNFRMSRLHFKFYGTRQNSTRFKISKFSMNLYRPVRPRSTRGFMDWSQSCGHVDLGGSKSGLLTWTSACKILILILRNILFSRIKLAF